MFTVWRRKEGQEWQTLMEVNDPQIAMAFFLSMTNHPTNPNGTKWDHEDVVNLAREMQVFGSIFETENKATKTVYLTAATDYTNAAGETITREGPPTQ